MNKKDYTFQLNQNSKFRYNAGSYDQESQTPKYKIDVSIPEHVKNQIKIKQFLMGEKGDNLWVWDIENNSTYPAFISIKKDDRLVLNDSH